MKNSVDVRSSSRWSVALYFVFNTVFLALVPCATATAQVPGGSYSTSCRQIVANGPNLNAECRRGNGSWTHTLLSDFRSCTDDIANIDGMLVCTYGLRPPLGSFRQSCPDFYMENTSLVGLCKPAGNGAIVLSRLANAWQCVGDISNQNGQLSCPRPAPPPAPKVLGQAVELGIDRIGNDYAVSQKASAQDCRQTCDADAKCQAYAYSTSRKLCWLKNPAPGVVSNADITSGVKNGDGSLTVAVANLDNQDDGSGGTWRVRYTRYAAQLANSGHIPDVLLLSEVSGYYYGTGPIGWADSRLNTDYEILAHLHKELLRLANVDYQIAYFVGTEAGVTDRGVAFQGDALLYRRDRLLNLGANDSASNHLEGHLSKARGVTLRRSLPACGQFGAYIAARMDGPLTTEKCNTPTPVGAAWTMFYDSSGAYKRVGAYAKLAFRSDPDRALEFYNSHFSYDGWPRNFCCIKDVRALLPVLVSTIKGRVTARHFAPLFGGDLNNLNSDLGAYQLMFPGTEILHWPDEDNVALNSVGPLDGSGVLGRAVYPARVLWRFTMPGGINPCDNPHKALRPDLLFSDHCAVMVTLDWTGTQ